MGRNLDKFWKYAERLQAGFRCKFCNKCFGGGSTRLKFHLSGVGHEIGKCDQVPADVQSEAFLAVEGRNVKAKNAADLIVQDSGPNLSDWQQSAVSRLFTKKNKDEVDQLLAKFIISNNIEFSAIQASPFKEFVRSVAAYGPNYEVPSNSILVTKVIPDCVTEVDRYIENAKKEWATTGCTLMFDMSGIRQGAVLNIIAYSPGGAVLMNSSEITHDDETCMLIKGQVSSVIDDIGPCNVVQFITDDVPNIESAADLIIKEYPGIYKTKCAADGVQLLLKDIFGDLNWVRNTIDDAERIVSHMYGHTTVLSLMRQCTKDRELKHSCRTRYASNYKMLKSLLDVENELQLLVETSEWGGIQYNKGEMAQKVTRIIQNSDFWSQAGKVLQAMEPLVQVLRLVEGVGSTSGYLYQAMERAQETIRELYHNDGANHTKMWRLFEERRQNIIHPLHAAAAILNPSYMCSENFKENEELTKGIDFMVENLVSDHETEDFVQQFLTYRAKDSTLFTLVAEVMLKTSHPRVWWDFCGKSLPILKKYAIRILSQPCSASSWKRNWSAFEAAQTKKRLQPHILNNPIHVRMNMLMMEEFCIIKRQNQKAIDLEELNELPEYFDPLEDGRGRTTNITRDNLTLDIGVFTETGYKGDQAHSVDGNGELDRSMTEQPSEKFTDLDICAMMADSEETKAFLEQLEEGKELDDAVSIGYSQTGGSCLDLEEPGVALRTGSSDDFLTLNLKMS